MKTVVSFQAPHRFSLEESERHYLATHVPLAARVFNDNPGCVAYHTLRAHRQLAPTGRFDHRLTAYRFTEIWYSDDHPATPSEDVAHFFDSDVPFCIRDMRRFIVNEEIVVSKQAAAGSPAHYLIEADATDPSAGAAVVRSIVTALLASPEGGVIRRLWVNWIEQENLVEDGDEPGQRHTSTMMSSTTKVAFAFLIVDNPRMGEKLFGQEEVCDLLLSRGDLLVRVLELSRTVELDKTGSAS